MITSEKRSLVEELHRPARRKFPRRRTIIRNLRDLFQVDLVEMIPYEKENKGYKYILTCINCFSKYAYCCPLKSKTSSEVAFQMEENILKKLKKTQIPKHVQSDAGTEFMGKPYQTLMKKYHIKHYTTYSPIKAAIIERFNRSLKTRMWIEFGVQGTYNWIDILQNLVKNYNARKHRTIGMCPQDVTKKDESSIFLKLNQPKIILKENPKFKTGQFVRISKHKNIFDKGYQPNWSYEVFKIVKVSRTYPRVYHLIDYEENLIKGGFYEHELQATQNPNTFLVEKVLKRRGKKVFVKYFGFPDSANEWIPLSSVVK